jgi:hypothetical protein
MWIDKMPLTGIARFAIPDDPATYEEKTPSIQPLLFNLELNEDEEDGADA